MICIISAAVLQIAAWEFWRHNADYPQVNAVNGIMSPDYHRRL